MTFLSLRSPFGGNKLASLYRGRMAEINAIIEPEKKPMAIGDYIVFKIGYAHKDLQRGEAIHIKATEAVELYKLLKSEFGV